MKNVLIGADPEGFLFDETNNKFVSAIGKIGGTKADPMVMDDITSVQEDNVAVEFNIKPAKTREEFIEHIRHSIGVIGDLAYPLVPRFETTVLFDDEELDNPAAKQIGCDPDFSVYGGVCELKEYVENRRFAAGHIHIGYDDPTEEKSKALVPYLDLHLGVRSILFDQDTQRRQYYGRAGSIRLKPYGLEYRVSSNWWLNNEDRVGLVYDLVMKAIEHYLSGEPIKHIPEIQKAINESNVELAKQILSQYK